MDKKKGHEVSVLIDLLRNYFLEEAAGVCGFKAKEEVLRENRIPEEVNGSTRFPGKYEELGKEIGELVDKKNAAYGDSFNKSGNILRELYPKGIRPDQYDDAMGIVRVIDKMFRIATDKAAFGENPWQDIGGYGILKSLAPCSEAQKGV